VGARAIASPWFAHADRLAQKHRRPVAIAFSLAVHVLFVLLLLVEKPTGLAGGGFAGQGTAPGSGTAVTLVDGAALDQMDLTTVKATTADAAEEQITPIAATQADDMTLAATDSLVAPQLLAPPQTQTFPTQAAAQAGGRAGSPGDGGAGNAGDDLWGAIAPCWKRLADNKTLPVTLRVTFASDGNLAAPPVIDADPAMQADVNVQRSETIAMQALAQCGAYAMAEGKSDVRINFPTP
jgi:hypothetical protein